MEWTDLYDQYSAEKPEGDDVSAEHINRIAHAVIAAEGKIEDLEEAVGDVYTKSQVYTKTEIDDTVSELQGDIDSRALAADVYTKDETYTQQEAVRKFSYLEAALGNSIQIKDTIAAILAELQLRGETTVRRVVFSSGNTVDRLDGGTWPFANGASLTFTGLDSAVSANNKTVTVTTVSGSRMTFPTSTFVNGVSLSGTITDGTNTVHITLSADHPQTLDSLHSFEIVASGKNCFKTPRSTSDLETISSGITTTFNPDGSMIFSCSTGTYKYVNSKTYSLKPNTSYTLTVDALSTAGVKQINIMHNGGGVTYTTITTSRATHTKTFTTDSTGKFHVRYYLIGATIESVTMTVYFTQIEEGKVSTAFEEGETVAVPITLKDTSGNTLYAHGIPLTYNLDGSVATYSAQGKITKVGDKWRLIPDTYTSTIDSSITPEQITDVEANDYIHVYYRINKTYVPNIPADSNKYTICNLFKVDAGAAGTPLKNTLSRHNGYWTFVIGLPKSVLTGYSYALTNSEKIQLIKNYFGSNNCIIITNTTDAGKVPIELHADNQTVLNDIAKSFDGTTNIMLSVPYGQIYADAAKNITKVIDDIKAAIALLG